MKIKHISSVFIGVFTFLLLVVFDQITKRLAVIHLKNQEPVILIKHVFQFCYLENRGAAFGILQGGRPLFLLITFVVLFVLAYCYVRAPYTDRFRPLRVILVMIAAGAVGNFIDRCTQGYVVDFFYFEWINFPIFNVADIYVTLSAACLILLVIFYYREKDFEEFTKSLGLVKKEERT